MGLLEDRKKSQYLQMAEEKLQGLLNLPMQAQRFITNPTAFLGLLGQNPLPRESGFAAGATGLPPTEMSVLDSNQAPYMQGYGQGEPVGYAGMALPFAAPAAVVTGRALAPKAGQALESYMVNQGLLQPLTAYHGTPHNIQGKFDINKVGTGEGAQAFGHGMYFAENPSVAEGYQKNLGRWIDRIRIGDTEMSVFDAMSKYADEGANAAKVLERMKTKGQLSIDQYNNMIQDVVIPEIRTNAKILQEKWGDVEGLAGNLYKVDIPDAYIPTMMDYDKPLGQQNAIVKKALNEIKKQITPEMKMELGGDMNLLFGKDITPVQFLNTMEIIHPTGGVGIGEKMLNDLGVKGIRYKDAMSRGADEGTSNFVVFDPTDVKILEKNKKKVEGLLD